MPFPELYSNILFACITVFCTVISLASVPFYNTLHKKELLSEKFPSHKASSPLIYIFCAVFGAAVGVLFALKDIDIADVFLVLMIPSAVTVSVCDALNGFIPLAGLVFSGICVVLRTAAVCFSEGSAWHLLTFFSGAVFAVVLMFFINFIAKKTGSAPSDIGHIALIAILFACAGIVPGTAILAAAEIAALLFYILPVFIISGKNSEGIKLSSVSYPLAPFMTVCFYAAAVFGIFR
ncbi:MAG: hypothetical protein IJK34_09615 [Clostridia bacterium]|nr:hypothetical protein [Clostridia bacterium]